MILVPLVATLVGLVYAVLVDRTRFEYLAKTLDLPADGDLHGRRVDHLEVRLRVQAGPAGRRTRPVLLNQLLVWIGLEPQQFLLGAPANTFFLIVVMIWIQAGFSMTVLSAAIKAIPDDIVEAARLDGLHGAGHVPLHHVPSIRPALIVVVTTIAMGTLKVFDIVRTMTGGNFDTSVVANEFYNQSFRASEPGPRCRARGDPLHPRGARWSSTTSASSA